MLLLLYTLVELLKKVAITRISGASSGRYRQRVKPMVSQPQDPSVQLLTTSAGVQVYGFMTIAEDAKCGVCAHELGHLGNFASSTYPNPSDEYHSLRLA